MAVNKAQKLAETCTNYSHPHLLNLYGFCEIDKLPCLVYEDALHGNFSQYFSVRANRESFWKLFVQASAALLYLKTKNMAHGKLKCSNILVGADGKAKVSDFGLGLIQHSSDVQDCRWMAPECLSGDVANSIFPSDVYAFGMSILEVWTGDVPWGKHASEEGIKEAVCAGTIPPRPVDMSDRAWELIQKMCRAAPLCRLMMTEVYDELYMLMNEDMMIRGVSCCSFCSSTISISDKFCAVCGFKTMLLDQQQSEENQIAIDFDCDTMETGAMSSAVYKSQECDDCGFVVSCCPISKKMLRFR